MLYFRNWVEIFEILPIVHSDGLHLEIHTQCRAQVGHEDTLEKVKSDLVLIIVLIIEIHLCYSVDKGCFSYSRVPSKDHLHYFSRLNEKLCFDI